MATGRKSNKDTGVSETKTRMNMEKTTTIHSQIMLSQVPHGSAFVFLKHQLPMPHGRPVRGDFANSVGGH